MVNLRQAADEGQGAELAAERSSRGQSIMAVGEGNAKASGGDAARAGGARGRGSAGQGDWGREGRRTRELRVDGEFGIGFRGS